MTINVWKKCPRCEEKKIILNGYFCSDCGGLKMNKEEKIKNIESWIKNVNPSSRYSEMFNKIRMKILNNKEFLEYFIDIIDKTNKENFLFQDDDFDAGYIHAIWYQYINDPYKMSLKNWEKLSSD